jgi:hypothetical protein
MIETTQRALLIAQIATLQREQRESSANTIYLGWTCRVSLSSRSFIVWMNCL